MNYQTGATFYPGGDDSYYMPEIVQPAPHRAGEHPMDMAHNVASMEQVAQGRDVKERSIPNGSYVSGINVVPQNGGFQNEVQNGVQNVAPQSMAPPVQHVQQHQQQQKQQHHSPEPYQQPQYLTGLAENPNFSPFPVILNPTPNIPPTDEQKEETLEAARVQVLTCNDPEVQLTWARDALAYVEIAQQNESRVAKIHGARPRTPRIEHALRQDALKIVNFLADQHHPTAEFMRGMWLEFGKFGERIDKREAFYCYQRASERRYARADYRIGMQFESSNDALKAIKYYQKGVDAGDSAANYRLGMMTLLGQHGQPQDFERGARMIEYSASTADENAPQGAFVYGMLQAGELPQIQVPEQFVARDLAAAKINIEKAAYLGFAKAQLRMGQAYELGELGCQFDAALSLHYYHLAARQGEAEAEMAISKWFLCGEEGVLEKNESEAYDYAQRAALDGLDTAQFAMGYFYEVGIHVKPDFTRAKEWYRQASDNGNSDASARIQAISRSKTLSRKDHEQVALSKIRGQHGSVYQTTSHPSMPPIREAARPLPTAAAAPIDMPDPSRLSLNSSSPAPARPYSAAPYPQSNGPPAVTSAQNAEFRPTSAFGINPNLRPNSVNSAVPNPGSYGRPTPSPYGRPSPYPNQHPNPYGRPVGAYRPHGSSAPAPPPKPYTPAPAPVPAPSVPQVSQTPQPRVDIGFVAPLDPTGADRRNRPQDPWLNRAQQPAAGTAAAAAAAAAAHASRKGSGPGTRLPLPPQQTQPQKLPSNKTPLPPNNTPRPTITAVASATSSAPTLHQTPTVTSPSTTATPAPASAEANNNNNNPKPSGGGSSSASGPQTFEEMGILRTKEKRECIVM